MKNLKIIWQKKNNTKEIASKNDPLKININKNSHYQTYFYYKQKNQPNDENLNEYNKENNNYILNDNNALLYKNNSKDKNSKNIDNCFNKTINNDLLNRKNLLNKENRNIQIIKDNKKRNNSNQKDNNFKKNELFIQKFFQLKGFSCFEELINWIIKVKQYKNFIIKIKNLYLSSNYNNNINKNAFYDDILSWINQNNININNNKNIYRDYCKEIMKNNNLTKIEEFKGFMNQILNKNKQNSEFLKGMKEIFLHNFVPKAINGNNYKEISYNNKIFLNE